MSIPPDPERPQRGPVLEPIRVLRPRRFDALAELMEEMRQDAERQAAAGTARPPGGTDGATGDQADGEAEDRTEELPPVAADASAPFPRSAPTGPRPAARGPGRRSPTPHPTPRPRSAAPRPGARTRSPGAYPHPHSDPRPGPRPRSLGFGPGLRRAAVAVAVGAAALVGFGCALLLPGRQDAAASVRPAPSATAPSAPSATTAPATTGPTGAADPDGAGTLRQGDSGPDVTELQQRLLRIPDVYRNGSTDGTYDATLTAAVARFQLWYGIRGDENGVYGDDTRRALESRTGQGHG
ncbi:peptidoglycan-binding protein [Streptomyces sp. NPDC006739]|uniref:peptidoglycan-binding domain-containing protein n=1 Tax=Streptomyces sp. NPDC006739 TaxID=3364763 RepID=UPI0036CC0EF3